MRGHQFLIGYTLRDPPVADAADSIHLPGITVIPGNKLAVYVVRIACTSCASAKGMLEIITFAEPKVVNSSSIRCIPS